jgi:hypothetical protein
MVESQVSYDLLPNVDQKANAATVKKVVEATLKAPGVVEFRAHRGLIASSQMHGTTVWQTITDWAKFVEGPWQQLEAELRIYATNIKLELWGPSPIIAEPLRPGK